MAKLSKLSLLSSFFLSLRPPKVGKKLNVAQNVFMGNLCLEVLEFALALYGGKHVNHISV